MIIKFNFYYYNIMYYNNNLQPHRLDGPSYETKDGDKFWCQNGIRHREDGPAAELSNNHQYYYLNGRSYSLPDYWKIIRFKGYL